MKSTMAESLGQMKDTIDQLVVEEGPSGENDEQLQIAAKTDELPTEQSDKWGLKSPEVVNQLSRALTF